MIHLLGVAGGHVCRHVPGADEVPALAAHQLHRAGRGHAVGRNLRRAAEVAPAVRTRPPALRSLAETLSCHLASIHILNSGHYSSYEDLYLINHKMCTLVL